MPDFCSYRQAEEVKAVRENRDPHKICEQYALDLNLMTKEEIKVGGAVGGD